MIGQVKSFTKRPSAVTRRLFKPFADKAFKRPSFSKTRLILFGAIFSLVGGYTIYTIFAAGNTYYVATTGNDANVGSESAPFKTIQRAITAVSNNSCDTIIVKDGVYNATVDDSSFGDINKSGTADCMLTIKSENKWGAKLDGSITGTSSDGTNAAKTAFNLTNNAQYVRIEGFEIFNIADGSLVDTDGDGLFEHSEGPEGSASGIELYNGGANSEIVGNYIHNIGQTCTNTYNGQVAIFVKKTNVKVEGNVIANIGRYSPGVNGCSIYYSGNGYSLDHGMYINAGGVDGTVIKNNIFHNTDAGWGIQFYPSGSANVKVLNNTFGFCNSHKQYTCMVISGVTNLDIKNNIFYNPSGGQTIERASGASWTNTYISNNITSGSAMATSFPSAGVTQTNNQLNTDARIVNPPSDFRLQSGSPAIDAGVDLSADGVITDHEGTARPQGSSFDIGAYEIEIVTAHLWVDTTGGSCTRSAILASYNDSQACSSFDAAWDAASSGDTIRVKAATYSAQTITGHKTSEVKIIAESGTILTGPLNAEGNFLTVQNLTVNAGNAHGQTSGGYVGGSNVTFRDVNLHGAYVSIYVDGPNFTWQRGSLGQDGTTGGERQPACDGGNGDGEPVWLNADGATIDSIRFNPQLADDTPRSCSSNGFHLENIRVQGADNITVKNSWFLPGSDAGSGHIFLTTTSPSDPNQVTNFKLLNNVMEAVNGSYVLQQHSNVQSCGTYVVGYNTLHQELLFQCDTTTGMQWIGNLGVKAFGGCDGTYIKNVWQNNTNVSCGSDTWVSGPQWGIGNLGIGAGGRLNVGSPAIDAAETNTATDFCTGGLGSVDFEGGVRPSGPACDAGADEFGSTSATVTANIWVDGNGGSCTRSASTVTYNDAAACGTFNSALAVATRGDVVKVKAGTYAPQTLTSVPAGSSGYVLIQPSDGEVVQIGNGGAGNCKGSTSTFWQLCIEGADWVELRDFNVFNDGNVGAVGVVKTGSGVGTDNLILRNISALAVRMQGRVDNIQILGGEYGGDLTSGTFSHVSYLDTSGQFPSNITFDGVRFYNTQSDNPGDHMECILANAFTNLTLINSRFEMCGQNGQSTGNIHFNDDLGASSGYTIRNNFFGNNGSQPEVVINGDIAGTKTFEFNSVDGAVSITDGFAGGAMTVAGNYASQITCVGGVTYAYNVTTSSACSGTGNSQVGSLNFVDSSLTTWNLHLASGATGLDKVPAASCVTSDIDSDSRPLPGGSVNCDAGADESASSGGGGDTTDPSVPQNTTYTGDTATTIGLSWSASTDNVGVTGYRLYLNGASHATTTSTSYTYTGLTCGTTYTIGLTAYDAAGNESDLALNTGSHSTAACDTTSPTVSLSAPANGATVSGNNVTISATATDNVGVAGVQFKMDGFNQGAEDTSSPYSTTWDTTTLGNGIHTLTAIARDAAGNTTTSSVVTVTVNNTTSPPDTTPPTTPSGLSAGSTTTTTISLSWNASTDSGGSGLAGYRLYRDGTLITTTTQLNYTDNNAGAGLTPSTAYSYRISAVDNATNESTQSSPLSASTAANPAPVVSFTANPSSITEGSSSLLQWTTTNATSCSASGTWSGSKANSGSQSTGALTASSTYSLSCSGLGGTTVSNTTVTVTGSQAPAPTPSPTKLGDLNNDNIINIFDLSILLSHYGGTGAGDLNGDSSITVIDLSILLSNYGK